MNTPATRWLILISATLIVCQYANAGVMNGDFSDTTIPVFTDWTTLYGDAPTDGGGVASFNAIDFFDETQLEQTFSLPTGATRLSFEFSLSSVAGGGSGGIGFDIFQATLFDASWDPLFPIVPGPFGDSRFFALDADQQPFKSTEVTVDEFTIGTVAWKRVSLDVSSLPTQDLTLEFLLLGADDELATTVLLDNVMVGQSASIVPEPATMAIWVVLGTATMGLRRKRRFKCNVL